MTPVYRGLVAQPQTRTITKTNFDMDTYTATYSTDAYNTVTDISTNTTSNENRSPHALGNSATYLCFCTPHLLSHATGGA
jgi:hypothetical protein